MAKEEDIGRPEWRYYELPGFRILQRGAPTYANIPGTGPNGMTCGHCKYLEGKPSDQVCSKVASMLGISNDECGIIEPRMPACKHFKQASRKHLPKRRAK